MLKGGERMLFLNIKCILTAMDIEGDDSLHRGSKQRETRRSYDYKW